MKLYIYDTETMVVVATATGETNGGCENKAAAYLGTSGYAGTYTPAFGNTGGLIEGSDAEKL